MNEATPQALEAEQTAQPAPEAGFSLPDDDAELEAIWDKAEEQPEEPSVARDEATGQFKSTEATEDGEPQETAATEGEVEGQGEESGEEQATSPETTGVPLPSNWNGMEAAWEKIPEDIRQDIAERENTIHKTLSDQGRQIAAARPITDVVERNRDQFEGIKLQDGSTPTPDQAVEYLFNMNHAINTNPVATIIELADAFKVREQIAVKLGASATPQEGGNESALREEIAGLKQHIQQLANPANIDQRITQHLEQDRQLRDGEALISRLTKDKPLYAEIPDSSMVTFIEMARENMGEEASAEAVFNSAYDMAVNAIPSLRAKVAAAQPAATDNPKKVADAKRANGVNVTSTSSGKSPQLSEEEELGAAYDKAQRN